MALRMLSHLGWPWECFKSPATPSGTILDEYGKMDGIVAGHAQEGVPKQT